MNDNKKNIVLTGFAGVGKTSIGKSLAQKIGYGFIDTDSEIESYCRMNITDIFARYGEEYFRRIERAVVERVSRDMRYVIATGGGTVLDSKNVSALRENGIIVLLKASVDTIMRNLKKDKIRPLLGQDLSIKKLDDVVRVREKFYQDFDVAINVDDLDLRETTEKIAALLIERNII